MTDTEIIQKLLDRTHNISLSLESMLAQYHQDRNPTLFIQKIPFIIASLDMTPEYVEDWREE